MAGPAGHSGSRDFAGLDLGDRIAIRLRVAIIVEILAETVATSMAGSVTLDGLREMAASVDEIDLGESEDPTAARLADYVRSEVAELLIVMAERAGLMDLHEITSDQLQTLAKLRQDMVARYMMLHHVEQILRDGDGDFDRKITPADVASWVGMKPGDGVDEIMIALRRLMS
jgi:hypothetical protein